MKDNYSQPQASVIKFDGAALFCQSRADDIGGSTNPYTEDNVFGLF